MGEFGEMISDAAKVMLGLGISDRADCPAERPGGAEDILRQERDSIIRSGSPGELDGYIPESEMPYND